MRCGVAILSYTAIVLCLWKTLRCLWIACWRRCIVVLMVVVVRRLIWLALACELGRVRWLLIRLGLSVCLRRRLLIRLRLPISRRGIPRIRRLTVAELWLRLRLWLLPSRRLDRR